MKILVVDDSSTMRRLIINLLSSKVGDIEFHEAEDGKEAVMKFKEQPFDVIFMDMFMPNMNGVDAVKKIRLNDKKVKIIMVTTNVDKNNILMALKAGVNNYVVKPFTSEFLLQKFQDTLSRQ